MLEKGDTIAIIALAGDCDREKINSAVANIQALGYKVKISKNIYEQNKYLAGSDEDKTEELHSFFLDSKIKLILNARGGYGSIRLINKIDYEIIKNNPKPFCGFSDITALLLMFYKKCGLKTFHSPMACSDFVELNDFTINNFFNTINNQEQIEIQTQKRAFEKKPKKLQEALDYMHENFTNMDTTVQSTAEHIHASTAYLRKIFRSNV